MHCWTESLQRWSFVRQSWRRLAAVMRSGSLTLEHTCALCDSAAAAWRLLLRACSISQGRGGGCAELYGCMWKWTDAW